MDNSTFINLDNYSPPSIPYKPIGPSEAIKNVANRILHSSGYKRWYLSMGGLSIFALILSLWEICPRYYPSYQPLSTLFYTLEIIVNVGMVAEVSTIAFLFPGYHPNHSPRTQILARNLEHHRRFLNHLLYLFSNLPLHRRLLSHPNT